MKIPAQKRTIKRSSHFSRDPFTLISSILFIFLIIPPCFIDGSSRSSAFPASFFGGQTSDSEVDIYETTKKSLLESRQNSRYRGDKASELKTLIEMGELEYFYGFSARAGDYFEEALLLADTINDNAKKGLLLQYLKILSCFDTAAELSDNERFEDAIDELEKVLSITKEIGSEMFEMRCLRKLSIQYYQNGEFEKMSSLNQESLLLARKLGNKTDEMRCLYNIGIAFQKNQEYAQSLSYYEDALRLSLELRKKGDESSTLYNMAEIYSLLGNYDKSLEYMSRILELDEKADLSEYIAMDLNMIGVTHFKKALLTESSESFDNARRSLQKSLAFAQKHGFANTEIDVLNNLGRIEMEESRFETALNHFQEALEKAVSLGDMSEAANIHINIGIGNSRLLRYDAAFSHFSEAINLQKDRNLDYILWEAYAERADTFMQREEFAKAVTDYERSIQLIEGLRSGIQLDELKASFLGTDKRIEVYRGLVDALFRIGEREHNPDFSLEAFNLMEQSKARSLLDRLDSSKVDITLGVDPALLNEEERLLQLISRSNSKLYAEGLSSQAAENLQNTLRKSEENLDAVHRKMRITSPTYASLRNPQIISIDEAKTLLPDEETGIFAYSLGRRKSYLFVITSADFSVYPLPPASDIHDLVRRYLTVLSDKDNFDFSHGQTLYRILVEPALNDKIRNLFIIPDDILHYLPFETLWADKSTDSPVWLISNVRVSYAPSVTSLREIMSPARRTEKQPMDILAFGDPYYGEDEEKFEDQAPFFRLRFSGVEIEKIRSHFPAKKTKVFLRREATEFELKQQDLEAFKIIHFAAHGLIDDKIPSRSSIVLSRENGTMEDGFLQMREIYDLKLNADLITLSACRTGLGRHIRGEGIIGLSQAFFYAGASSAMLSLWPVNDQASAQLMDHFYNHLRSGKAVSTALQLTKKTMIGSEFVSHPYYWASFVLSGNADSPLFSKRFPYLVLFPCLLLIALLLFLLRRRNRAAKR